MYSFFYSFYRILLHKFSCVRSCMWCVCLLQDGMEVICPEEEVMDSDDNTEEDLGVLDDQRSVILHLLSQLKLGMDLTRVRITTTIRGVAGNSHPPPPAPRSHQYCVILELHLTLKCLSVCRLFFPHSSWRSVHCWRCMLTSWRTRTCSCPSLPEALQRSVWCVSLNITWPPSMKDVRALLPRSPTIRCWARPSTARGRFHKIESALWGLRPTPGSIRRRRGRGQTVTGCVSWRSRFPIILRCRGFTVSVQREACVSTHTSGPRASSWACQWASLWWEKVGQFLLRGC